MKSKAQAVEICPTAQDVLESERTHEIGKWVRWIGKNPDYGVLRRARERGKDFPVDVRVHVKQPQPASRIVPVRRPTSLFVRASADHH